MAPPTKNSKPVFKTSSPFAETTWPHIAPEDQDIILDLVCNLITPIGDHRRTHIIPSKGKKRKRSAKENKHEDANEPANKSDTSMPDTPPPPPRIAKHILVGINSITRHLEASAAKTAPGTTPAAQKEGEEEKEENDAPKPLSIVLITHPKPSSSIAHAHIPTLLHLSTLSPNSSSQTQTKTQTRLIPLPSSTDARLASKLNIPRVGALAIYSGAPGAKALEEFVREKVGVTECMWVEEARRAEWMGLNVKCEVGGGGGEGGGKKAAKTEGK